jgi:hypothetical protein
MSLKRESIFYDIFNVSHPWEIIIVSVSKHTLLIDFKFDYTSNTLCCPLCNAETSVAGKTAFTWEYLDLLEYATRMTAYVPIIGDHNPSCKASRDTSAISNLLLLDLIIQQQKNTGITNPLRHLFNAATLCQAR